MTPNTAREPIVGARLVEAGYPAIRLPNLAKRVNSGIIHGRYPSHGYMRGWGLEFGDLGKQIAAHPLYAAAIAASRGRSVMNTHRLMNLFLIVACFFDALADRDIVEFGSYRGGSALFLSYLLQRLYPRARVFAHDTFSGMPAVDGTADLHARGDFGDPDLAGLRAAKDELGLDNLTLIEGLVQDTFPASVPHGVRFGLAHLDMDIYEPTAFAQAAVWPFVTHGGYLVYDDATVSSCIGATQAVEELVQARRLHSEQVYPHFVFRVGLSAYGNVAG